MRTIVIGDVHGCYNELRKLIKLLEEEGEYNKDTDKLVFLGDYIDRGKDSRLVIKFIRNLQKENNNVIALMGNHEDMLLDFYNGTDNLWTFNGHVDTMESYKGYDKQLEDDIKWMANLPLYYEDEHFVYVHAGVDTYKSLKEQDRHTLLWIREPFIYGKKYHKTVVFGHTPTLNLNSNSKPVYTWGGNIDIDTGCVYDGALTALVIEDDNVEGFYQIQKEKEINYKKANA